MTTPEEAARMELTPPGRDVSQAEQDGWLKGGAGGTAIVMEYIVTVGAGGGGDRAPAKAAGVKFNPAAQPTDLARRLLKSSNAMTFADGVEHRGGWFDPVGHTRHAGFVFDWRRK